MGISRTFQVAKLVPGMTALENVMSGVHSYTKPNIRKTFLRLPFTASPEEKEISDANASCIRTDMRNRDDIYNLKRPRFSKTRSKKGGEEYRQGVEVCYLF
jgi:ABC-type branched-subunit amino acid transport system ATPase component